MNAESAFECWAPPESPWSPWVKPVLFAHGPASFPPAFDTEPWKKLSIANLPRSEDRIALVIDLPGVSSVDVGLVAALQGYRPVPLFNAVTGVNPVIDLSAIRHRLICDAANIQMMPLPADAPPAFLLDSRRYSTGPYIAPGYFDNRWVALPQDFPSARFLQSQDIHSVCLINQKGQPPLADLAHVLHGWQKDGLLISVLGLESGQPPQPITVSRPSYFGALWYRWLALIGLRRHAGGGFGSTIPMPSTSSGYG